MAIDRRRERWVDSCHRNLARPRLDRHRQDFSMLSQCPREPAQAVGKLVGPIKVVGVMSWIKL